MTQPSTHELTSLDAVRLVAGREISTRTRTRAFKITTIGMLVLVIAFIIAVKLIAGEGSTSNVGFSSSATDLAQPFASLSAAVDQKVTTTTVDDATGEQQVRDGKLDAFVTGTRSNFQVTVKKHLPDSLKGLFTVLARQNVLNDEITRAGGDPAAVNAAVNSAAVPVRELEPSADFQGARIAVGIVVSVLVYIAVMLYGQAVAQGVVEEKTSRIVEMLLTTIRPWQLMIGKVLGIGVVGLAQLALVAVTGVIVGNATGAVDFPASILASAAGWAVAWFLLGFLMYALIFAGLGALVSRQEDVGGVTAPALMLIILPYVAGISILPSDPDNKVIAIASVIPLFAPMLMPMRVALGVAPLWEVLLAAGLSLLLIVALVWLAGRIYSNAVLRTGSRVKFSHAWQAT
jgi:ABC-2 type transport system permease protein